MNKEIIKKLENKEFVQKLLLLKNKDDVQKLFKHQGIEISDKELNELGEILFAVTERIESMDKDDLEKVAGGDVVFSDYFKKAGEHYGVHKGGTPSVRGPWWKLGFGGKPGTPADPGTPVGNFLYDNSNELALTSIAGMTAVAAFAALYAVEKGKNWYKNRDQELKI